MTPTELSRMAIKVNSELLPLYALNDVLISDPNPAAVSRFSFRYNYEIQIQIQIQIVS